MAFAHDSVRVLQCFIQFGSHEQRQEVFEEVKGEHTSFRFFIRYPFNCAVVVVVVVSICMAVISMFKTTVELI